MLKYTIETLWIAIAAFMGEEHNLESIKTNNPFKGIVGTRWISEIKRAATIGADENKSFNTNKVKAMLDFLKVDYFMDGGVVVIKQNKTSCEK